MCVRAEITEEKRVPLVSHHDESIRFTNSTISVLKPLLQGGVSNPSFLLQPALRLQNIEHWKRTGSMSAFGCYFMAFGALADPTWLEEFHALVSDFLVHRLGIPEERVVWRYSSRDVELARAVKALGMPSEADGCEPIRYRHVFGVGGTTGRNSNVAIRTDHGLFDVGNVILIEHNGVPVGVEMAFGINNLLSRAENLAHPVHASVAHGVIRELGCRPDFGSEIETDALGSAAALALDGLRPSGRGRGRNFRDFLKVLAPSLNYSRMEETVQAATRAEMELRTVASEPDGFEDLRPEEAADIILTGLRKISPSIGPVSTAPQKVTS